MSLGGYQEDDASVPDAGASDGRDAGTSSVVEMPFDAELSFEPEPQSVPEARSFVASLGLTHDEDTQARLATLTSEVVTNAILHARTALVVRVMRDQSHIRVSVSDNNSDPVVLKSYGPSSPTGRGLHIVKALADRWGVEETADGKAVWFELDHEAESA